MTQEKQWFPKLRINFNFWNTLWINRRSIYFFIYTFIHLFTYSSIHIFAYSYIHLFNHSSIHLFTYSSINLFIYSSIQAEDPGQLESIPLIGKLFSRKKQERLLTLYTVCTLGMLSTGIHHLFDILYDKLGTQFAWKPTELNLKFNPLNLNSNALNLNFTPHLKFPHLT